MAENQNSAQSTSSSISSDPSSISDITNSYSSELQQLKKVMGINPHIITPENMEITLGEVGFSARDLYRSDAFRIADQQIQDRLTDLLLRVSETEGGDMEQKDEYQQPPHQPIPQSDHQSHQQLPQPEGHQSTQQMYPPPQNEVWELRVFQHPRQARLRLPQSKGWNIAQVYRGPRTRSQAHQLED
ncbi:hypothetical protein EAF04_002511 [Stromatinia cepivora]|nr:hypothetical protein EAF04_002511 [Stromatinia cepivora]